MHSCIGHFSFIKVYPCLREINFIHTYIHTYIHTHFVLIKILKGHISFGSKTHDNSQTFFSKYTKIYFDNIQVPQMYTFQDACK